MGNSEKYLGYHMEHGQLLYKGRMVISKDPVVIPLLLGEYHDSAIGGHYGEAKTYLKVVAEWF